MPTATPFLRVEQESPTQLTLVSPDRRWLILILTLMYTLPLVFLSATLVISVEEARIFGIAGMALGLVIMGLILLYSPVKSQLVIDSSWRKVTLVRHYWLGFGGLEKDREKVWSFNDITDVHLVRNKQIEIETNGKKELILSFGGRVVDAKRSYDVMQSWRKGLSPEFDDAAKVLNKLASEKQIRTTLKNAEKMLFIFGTFSLIYGAIVLFTENIFTANISLTTAINIATGLIYLACGYGVKRRPETALWVAILVVIAERIYWFIRSGPLDGNGNWSSWLMWVFAFFIVSSLWQAIQGNRTMAKNPAYEPPM